MPLHPTSWRSILILSFRLCLGLPSGLVSSVFPIKPLYTPLPSPINATCSASLIVLDFITRTMLGESKNHEAPHCVVFSIPFYLLCLRPTFFFSTLFSNTLSLRFSLSVDARLITGEITCLTWSPYVPHLANEDPRCCSKIIVIITLEFSPRSFRFFWPSNCHTYFSLTPCVPHVLSIHLAGIVLIVFGEVHSYEARPDVRFCTFRVNFLPLWMMFSTEQYRDTRTYCASGWSLFSDGEAVNNKIAHGELIF